MEKQFNLSEKIVQGSRGFGKNKNKFGALYTEDVKEFIKRLKKEIEKDWNIAQIFDVKDVNKIIDKLAGDKLI